MSFFVAVAIVVGSIWIAAYVRHGSLIWAVLLFLLLNSAFGSLFWQQQVGPLPLTLDRIALIGLLALFAIHLRWGRTDPKPLGPADWLLIAFLAVLAFSTFTHDWKTAPPPEGVAPLWRLVIGYLGPAVIYWIGRRMKFGPRQSKEFLAALTLFGIYLSVTAILEITHQWSLVFPRTIADPNVGLHYGRARGPMLHAVPFGFYVGACLVAACIWLSRAGRAGILALAALVPLFLAATYFSYTRSVWIGVALGVGLILALTLQGAWRTTILGAAVCASALVGVRYWDKFIAFEREYSAAGTEQSAGLRKIFAYVSWQMFLDHPLLGCGFGQFYVEKLPYLSDRSTELELESIRPLIHHNMPLNLLSETGLIGLSLFSALVAAWVVDAWRLWRNTHQPDWVRRQSLFCLAVLAVYIPQALFHEVSYMNMVHMLLFFLAGVSTGLYQATVPKRIRRAAIAIPRGLPRPA